MSNLLTLQSREHGREIANKPSLPWFDKASLHQYSDTISSRSNGCDSEFLEALINNSKLSSRKEMAWSLKNGPNSERFHMSFLGSFMSRRKPHCFKPLLYFDQTFPVKIYCTNSPRFKNMKSVVFESTP